MSKTTINNYEDFFSLELEEIPFALAEERYKQSTYIKQGLIVHNKLANGQDCEPPFIRTWRGRVAQKQIRSLKIKSNKRVHFSTSDLDSIELKKEANKNACRQPIRRTTTKPLPRLFKVNTRPRTFHY